MPALLAALCIFGIFRWRHAVFAALILAVLEGGIRKWILPDAQEWVFFGKDALLLGAYLGFFRARLVARAPLLGRHPATGVLFAFGLLAVAQLANPSESSMLVGLYGVKSYLFYAPLMYMLPSLFPDRADLRRFALVLLLVALVPLLLGPIQFTSPADSVWNRYARESDTTDRALFGYSFAARVTGTFSYITGYTTFLTMLLQLALAFLVLERARRTRWIVGVVTALALVNLTLTGARGALLIICVTAAALLIVSAWMHRIPWGGTAVVLCAVVPVSWFLMTSVVPDAYESFAVRAMSTSDDPFDRAIGAITGPLDHIGESGLLGYGVGNLNQATSVFAAPAGASSLPVAENEWDRILLEVGPLGLLLMIAARLFVVWSLLRASVVARDTDLLPFVAGALFFTLGLVPGNVVFNTTAAIFYWFLAGFALLVPGSGRETERSPSERRRPVRPQLIGSGLMELGPEHGSRK
jgi:hypothetical protein